MVVGDELRLEIVEGKLGLQLGKIIMRRTGCDGLHGGSEQEKSQLSSA